MGKHAAHRTITDWHIRTYIKSATLTIKAWMGASCQQASSTNRC